MINTFKNLSNALLEKIKSYTPDWNENDSSSSHYIKNKPFYIVKDSYKTEGRVIIAEEHRIVPNPEVIDGYSITTLAPLRLGQTYIVTVNGVEYVPAPAAKHSDTDGEFCFIGNTTLFPADNIKNKVDTGEPFFIMWSDESDKYQYHPIIYFVDDYGLYTIKIETMGTVVVPDEVVKLDQKFVHNADWNQNDPNGDGYIKNRTHWKKEKIVEVLPLTHIENYIMFSNFGFQTINLYPDNKYIVEFNGEKYICEPKPYNQWGYLSIGNLSINDPTAEDTGEPFFFYTYGGYGSGLHANISGTIEIRISEYNYSLQKISKEYLPDDLVTEEFMTETIDKALANLRTSDVKFNSATINFLAMKDKVTGKDYFITIENGTIVCSSKVASIEITKAPDIMEYYEGTDLDSSGMIVTATYEDGKTSVITDYTHSELLFGNTSVEISYTENGVTCTTILDGLTIKSAEELLVDFTYTTNDDGTYRITDWKGTYNGVESTELHVPNNSRIIV